ncbi:MAG: cobalamin-independent methionine synthase II family protein [Alphaproteobacteria bacterium]|nr:cobalamin-independent methionine synthase II family protein [Alphaproteobacteria bacterium]
MTASRNGLPLLPTMGIGSYAAPGWFIAARRMIRDGGLGAGDIEELFDDATRIVIADQIEAGVDVITDGELRRQRFVYEMFDRIDGLTRTPPRRKLGIPGYDMAPSFVAEEVPSVSRGLGVVADFEALKRLVPDRALKIAIPGPLTFTSSIAPGGVGAAAVLDALTGIVRAELEALVAAGADYVQLDEPSLPHPPHGLEPEDGAGVINRVLTGLGAWRAVHVCFGNNAGRPRADRRLDRLMAALEALDCDQLVLEFANREMAGRECLAPLSERFAIAAGVIDVKNWRLETPADVARRIRQCLEHVAPDKLSVTADCGFSALPRYLARQKLTAMVAGAKQVRAAL